MLLWSQRPLPHPPRPPVPPQSPHNNDDRFLWEEEEEEESDFLFPAGRRDDGEETPHWRCNTVISQVCVCVGVSIKLTR